MSFNLKFKIVGECLLSEFLSWHRQHHYDIVDTDFSPALAESARKRASTIDHDYFFSHICASEYNSGVLSIDYYDEENIPDCELQENDIPLVWQYINLLFFEILLIKDNRELIGKYFPQETLTLNDDKVNITLFSCDPQHDAEVNIDYDKLHRKIKTLRARYPSLKIRTTIEMV